MYMKDLKKNWDKFGKTDPLWSILTHPSKKGNKWLLDEFFESGIKKIEMVMEYIESFDINIEHKKALDFGCGVGRLTQALANFFDEVHGVDIAPSMIELANNYNRYGNKCKYYVNEKNDLSLFSDNTFDFIYTTLTLQHMKPKYAKNYIKEFLRVLSLNGLLIFQIPSNPVRNLKGFIISYIPSFLYDIILKLKYINQPRMDFYWIQKEDVIKLLNNSRVKILDIKENQDVGSYFVSYEYCILKSARIQYQT